MVARDQRQQLSKVLARMCEISPSQGLLHALIHSSILIGLGGAIFVFWQNDVRLAVIATIPLAFFYTAVLVTSHDCIHRTYTGIKAFDDRWPYIWSWMIYWPHATYSELHKLHHAMLGNDFDDPERPTFLRSEFDKSGFAVRWYIRHQWLVNIFIFGGIGFIVKHWLTARRLRARFPQLEPAMRRDMVGISVMVVSQFLVFLYFDVLPQYLLSYFILERISGGLLQLRALAEHYGLWEGRHSDLTYRQAMSSRNIRAGWISRWLFNDLCFHSIHHVYPGIPWYKLGEAHLVIPVYWENVNQKLIEPKLSYTKVLADGVRSWRLIQDQA